MKKIYLIILNINIGNNFNFDTNKFYNILNNKILKIKLNFTIIEN